MIFSGDLGLSFGVIPAFIDHLAKSLAHDVCSEDVYIKEITSKCKEMMTATCLLFF